MTSVQSAMSEPEPDRDDLPARAAAGGSLPSLGKTGAAQRVGRVTAGGTLRRELTGAENHENVLDIQNLSKHYGDTLALDHVDLAVAKGELVTLLGPSGSGKTTLLKVIAGFEAPNSGGVLLRGRDISKLSPARRGVGMVFQHYALFPHMTVTQNIGYGLKLRRKPKAERERRVAEMLDLLHLGGLGGRYPRQLSGGQQQRVALGRALAYDPELILMDEPLGALDRALRIEMEQEIRSLHRELGATIVYVTHDQQEALALSDRIAIMRDGRVVGVDEPEQLYTRPPNSFVASFFANANLLPVERYELYGENAARVRCSGNEIECPCSAAPGEEVLLAIRRRSLRRAFTDGALPIEGVVAELLLFGDEREVCLDVAGIGRVVAVLDSRESEGLALGATLELFAPAGEPVLVPVLT
jgi:putative spermidine/putrescine transport system ATP-binding protein